MMRLTHLSESKLEELRTTVSRNLDRYTGSGFSDLAGDPGWSIELRQEVDLTGLEDLDGSDRSSELDLKNTVVIDRVLGTLSPSVANEERLWVRLSHVEGFAYCRDRWLVGASAEAQVAAINRHFFANTQTGIRDDHALARLWWNAYIVRKCFPADFARGLELLLHTADVRSNIVERLWLTSRRQLASGVFRKMDRDSRVLDSEASFRAFMRVLNVDGGGVVFEAMSEADIDLFLDRCADRALASRSTGQ